MPSYGTIGTPDRASRGDMGLRANVAFDKHDGCVLRVDGDRQGGAGAHRTGRAITLDRGGDHGSASGASRASTGDAAANKATVHQASVVGSRPEAAQGGCTDSRGPGSCVRQVGRCLGLPAGSMVVARPRPTVAINLVPGRVDAVRIY